MVTDLYFQHSALFGRENQYLVEGCNNGGETLQKHLEVVSFLSVKVNSVLLVIKWSKSENLV